MEPSTISQRLVFSRQFNEIWKLDTAHTLLCNLYEDIYCRMDAEVGPYEKDKTAATLTATIDLIHDALSTMYQLMGNTDYIGSIYHVEQAARLLELNKAEELHKRASTLSMRQGFPAELQEKLSTIYQFPDAEAIPALEALLAEWPQVPTGTREAAPKILGQQEADT